MKTLLPIFLTVTLGLSGCKLDLDTHSVDRFRLFASGDLILRLNTETGEVARVTEAGITPLSNAPDAVSPDVKALVDKYTSKPASELQPGESTTKGLPPGWSVKRDN
jgi:hypothetical protein